MERVRPLTVVAILVFALAGTGCVTVDPASKSVKLSVAPEAPPPPTLLQCMWQQRLATLQDPVRDGMKVQGLPGQMFLLTSTGAPAEITGDLNVMVFDETQRPNGVAPHRPESWHFDKATLNQLRTTDDRFGPMVALFLPWPPHWKDVRSVRIAARYVGPNKSADLSAGDTRMQLDLRPHDAPFWTKGPGDLPNQGAPAQAMYEQYGAPDPTKLLQQARGGAMPQQQYPPTGGLPPPTFTTPPQAPVQPTGGIQMPSQPIAAPPSSGPEPIPISPRR